MDVKKCLKHARRIPSRVLDVDPQFVIVSDQQGRDGGAGRIGELKADGHVRSQELALFERLKAKRALV